MRMVKSVLTNAVNKMSPNLRQDSMSAICICGATAGPTGHLHNPEPEIALTPIEKRVTVNLITSAVWAKRTTDTYTFELLENIISINKVLTCNGTLKVKVTTMYVSKIDLVESNILCLP